MNNPDELRNARKEKVIILDKFIKIYPKNKEKIFCFHEGKMDDKYYGTIVDLKVSSETYYFCCGGKSNVLNMRRELSKNKSCSGCKAMFFVDRDFDELFSYDDVFETPCYSVENLYVGNYTLRNILLREFYINEDSENYNKIMGLYEKLRKEFHEQIYVFNAWLYFQRKKERECGEKRKIHLKDKLDSKLEKIIYVNLDSVTVECKLEELQELFPEQYETRIADLQLLKSDFRYQDPSRWYRGKQEFYFFCIFILKVAEELGKCRKKNSQIFTYQEGMSKVELKIETKGNFERNMQILSSYAYIPQELKDYIDKMERRFKEVI